MHLFFDTKFHFPTVYNDIQVIIVSANALLKTVNVRFQFDYTHTCVLSMLRFARC
jgi:hypothetical protein